MTTSVPRLLGGRYEVGALIGRGGMAEVHLGHDTRLGRAVAIKILRSDHVRDAHFLGRFRREAQSVAGLNHPNIVAVYDSGEDVLIESGGARLPVPWIVMEYVDGHTLRELLSERGRLAPHEAARITENVLDALAYSHQMGMVHRDIKPANVMVAGDGSVKVMDFGIARAMADTQATMTQTSSVMGTAQYISPEQAEGLAVDSRSDIYSTGCLLFELLTGRTPFIGEPVSLTYQHVTKPPPLASSVNPEVPESLDAIIALALTKDRDLRYQDAGEFRDDLRSFRLGRAVSPAALAALRADQPTAPVTQVAPPVAHPTVPPVVPPVRDSAPAPAPAPRRRRGGALLIASILLLALGVSAFAAKVWLDSRPKMVLVPAVVGTTVETAQARLKQAGFDVSTSYTASRQVAEDDVISQDPRGGTSQVAGTQITLTVSGGPATTRVPVLEGLTEKEAADALAKAGLMLGTTTTVDSATHPKGQVVKTSPEAYADAAEGDTVNLTVASGRITVPDLTGKSEDDARNILGELQLPVVTEKEYSDEPEGTVLRQDPKAGKVKVGTSITLVLAIPRPITTTKTLTTTSTPTSSPPTTSEPPTITEPPEPTTTEPPSPSEPPTLTSSTPPSTQTSGPIP